LSRLAEHDDALVLRSVDYAEADRIVSLFTRQHGRLSAVARAARKSKRRFAGALEGFAVVDAELVLGSGELARLVSARVVRSFGILLGDLTRMSTAGALLRLARELIPERAPDEDLFDELVGMLAALDDASVPPATYRIAFELRLLALTGFAPLLSACGVCGKQPPTGKAAEFDPMRGSLLCRACGGASQHLRAELRLRMQAALEGQTLQVAKTAWSAEDQQIAQRLLELFIAHRLQRQPHDLKSR
jgi:DNA repair protein RecO (recombination protein O)